MAWLRSEMAVDFLTKLVYWGERPLFIAYGGGRDQKLPVMSVGTAGMVPLVGVCLLLGYAPINVSPHLPPPLLAEGGDLISFYLRICPRLRAFDQYYNWVKIYSPNVAIWSRYLLQGRGIWSNPHPLPVGGGGGTWGNTLIGALGLPEQDGFP